jgi:hypothetical protein
MCRLAIVNPLELFCKRHQMSAPRPIGGAWWLGIGWSLLVCCAVAVNPSVNAQEPAAVETAAAEQHLEEILVVGEQPGPAMWRVSKGDHALWIFATLECSASGRAVRAVLHSPGIGELEARLQLASRTSSVATSMSQSRARLQCRVSGR